MEPKEFAESVTTEEAKQASDTPQKKISFKDLFRYATKKDYFLLVIGTISTFIMGATQPMTLYLVAILFGTLKPQTKADEYYDAAVTFTYGMMTCSFIYIVSAYTAVRCFIVLGSRQSFHFRREYFKAIINCDPSWFDSRQLAEIPLSITSETLKIERATGDKLIILLVTSSTTIASLALALYMGTKLALVCLAFGPFIAGGLLIANNGFKNNSQVNDHSYKLAGGISEEALQETKTVAAFNGQKYVAEKYRVATKASYNSMLINGLKVGAGTGLGVASFIMLMGAVYLYAARLIDDDEDNWGDGEKFNVGKVICVMWVSIGGFNNLASCMPCIRMIVEGKAAARNIFEVIGTKSKLIQGKSTNEITGKIEFSNVGFKYPSSPDVNILNGLSFCLEPGQRLGVVGSTGSGKSTIIQLLLRYYEPSSGTIYIDDTNINEYSISYIRKNIGLVCQEPLLFNTSIYENIRYGKVSSTPHEIEEAASQAGALEFIEKLPDGFETLAGAKGSQLSGGQKQRIAIARAILKNPKILLLDEATSALDRQTEISVVNSLNDSMPSTTRITVAQNLLTLKDSDLIIIIDNGVVLESGTEEQLMEAQGKYYHMVKLQRIGMEEADVDADNNELVTKDKNLEKAKEEKIETSKEGVLGNILKISSSEKWWLFIGIFGSLIVGMAYPFVGMLSGSEMYTLVVQGDDLIEDSENYAKYLFIIAAAVFLGLFIQSASYPRVSSNITTKMRISSFKALLSYDSAFFDMPENNSSVISSRLSNDCEKLNGLGGHIFGVLLGIVTSLAISFGISASYSWRVAVVAIAIIPLMIVSALGAFLAQAKGMIAFDDESCSKYSADAVMNHKTVKAFNLEDVMLENFLEPVQKDCKIIEKKSHLSGIVYAMGFGILFLVYAFIYWYGAKLWRDNDDKFKNMIVASVTATMGTNAFFIAGVYIPDIKSGIVAAKALFKMLEHIPIININNKSGDRNEIIGKIEFRDVEFSYPNRKHLAIKNLSFEIEPKSSLAIIGRTGSGKSTVVQLLLRLYDPTSGAVLFDNKDIRTLNLKKLRSQIGFISQEPVLFFGSISENISYGIKNPNIELITDAAEKAQALEFINKNPDGFDRNVGVKGSMLSGGQKQRIAIARALIRDPKILILDEATSALDSQTESKLLEILKDFIKERTCIMIAHRLKTISQAEMVMVLEGGKILEFGKREELMTQGGYLYSMISAL